MATYEYRCSRCGRFETRRPIGTAPERLDCPECGRASRRLFSSPYLARMSTELGAALEHAESSRDQPEVVSEVPGKRATRRPHPALAHLPRP